jgi:hypothetical protein
MPVDTTKDVVFLDPLDAVEIAVRDTIRASNLGYQSGQVDCTYRGQPPPRMGSVFVAVWSPGDTRTGLDNPRDAWSESMTVNVTVTLRLTKAFDHWIDHRRELKFRVRQIAQLIHADVLDFRVTNRAKALLGELGTQGWIEPIAWLRTEGWQPQGPDWFHSPPTEEAQIRENGLSQTAVFGNGLRIEYIQAQIG